MSRETSKPTISRMELIRSRLETEAAQPSGVAWMGAYKLDVMWLVQAVERLLAEEHDTNAWWDAYERLELMFARPASEVFAEILDELGVDPEDVNGL